MADHQVTAGTTITANDTDAVLDDPGNMGPPVRSYAWQIAAVDIPAAAGSLQLLTTPAMIGAGDVRFAVRETSEAGTAVAYSTTVEVLSAGSGPVVVGGTGEITITDEGDLVAFTLTAIPLGARLEWAGGEAKTVVHSIDGGALVVTPGATSPFVVSATAGQDVLAGVSEAEATATAS